MAVSGMSRGVGLALMVLGVGGYVATGMTSPTALIPAAFGLVISMLGFYGRHTETRRTAMHLALGIAFAGVLGSMSGVVALLKWLSAQDAPLAGAVVSRSVMAVILIGYLAVGVRDLANNKS